MTSGDLQRSLNFEAENGYFDPYTGIIDEFKLQSCDILRSKLANSIILLICVFWVQICRLPNCICILVTYWYWMITELPDRKATFYPVYWHYIPDKSKILWDGNWSYFVNFGTNNSDLWVANLWLGSGRFHWGFDQIQQISSVYIGITDEYWVQSCVILWWMLAARLILLILVRLIQTCGLPICS